MAIYHCSIKVFSRGKGDSAVSKAAYRHGAKFYNEWNGETTDCSYKRDVIYTEIMLPKQAPASFSDSQTLWNSLEMAETRSNAQLARELEVSLPVELDFDEHLKIIHEYCEPFRQDGMCVDFCMHKKPNNPHCHIMLTMRPIDENGNWAPKSKTVFELDENGEKIRLPSGNFKQTKIDLTGWNDQANGEIWRKQWADVVNKYLEMNGFSERIDHRSNERRGLDEIPSIHMGAAACAMEKKGIATERGEINRQIKVANKIIREIRNKIRGLFDWISALVETMKEIHEEMKSPLLGDLILKYMDMESERLQKYSSKSRVKIQFANFNHLSELLEKAKTKGIYTLDDLEKAVKELHDKKYERTHVVISQENEMKELTKLIENAECLMKYNPIRKELNDIKWKSKKERYAEVHRTELSLWESSNRFFHAKKVDVSSLKSSVKTWKAELADLQKEHDVEYEQLKIDREEVKAMDELHKAIDKVLSPLQKEQQKQKKQNMER